MADNKEYERVDVNDEDDDEESESSTKRYSSEWEIFSHLYKDIMLHFKTSLMHKYTEKDKHDFLKQISECCVSRSNFDIYQILAFEATLYTPLDIHTVWQYRLKSFKAIICSLTQICAIIIILYELISNAKVGDKSKCRNLRVHGEWWMNLLAFLVSMNFSFTVLQKLNISNGLYKYVFLIDFDVSWIDHGWLYYGCIINSIVSINCVWGCFFIVFYADNALSMIFAVVSLFYLSRLDDALVQTGDYDQFKKSLENGFKGRDKKKARYWNRNCGSSSCCDVLENIFYIIFGIPWMLIKYITIIASIFMPFYFAACY